MTPASRLASRFAAHSVLLFAAFGLHAASFGVNDDGIGIDGGSFGSFTLSHPILLDGQQDLKPVDKTVAGRQATLRYANGARVQVKVANEGEIELTLEALPDRVRKLKMEMHIDFGFSDGGMWTIGDREAAFPAQKPEKPHLFQGTASTFRLLNRENKALTIRVPDHSFQQLQDNREWNWKIFHWMFIAPLQSGQRSLTLSLSMGTGAGGARSVVVVDAFGQDRQMDWPGKVKSADELRADVEKEKAYYAGFQRPMLDAFGGLPGSGDKLGLKKTGFFHVEEKGDRRFLVDPDGNLFFHLGICSFGAGEDYTYIKGRENLYAWLPPYDGEFRGAYHPDPYWSRDSFSFYLANLLRKFGRIDLDEHAGRMIERVRAFGFNSGGAFSGIPKAQREAARFPHVASLPISPWGTHPIRSMEGVRETFDPFDPGNIEALEKSFAESVAPGADDPLLIGYFLCNEPHHENLVHAIPMLKGNVAAKKRLVQMLQEKHKAIDAFNKAWGLNATSFEQLHDMGLAVKTAEASADMHAYEEIFFEEYFRLLRDTFRKYDRNHLLMGCRWQPQTANSETRCRLAGKYNEIVSVNYYTYGVDKTYLNRVHKWTGGKPLMLSEFHWCCPKESGLPGGKEVATQRERGLAYRNYVEQTAALGYVIGVEWFTLIDQARTGRFFEKYNSENNNCGLFSVVDRPWKAMVEEMAQSNRTIYEVLLGQRPPFVYEHPRFQESGGRKVVKAPRAVKPMKIDGMTDDWPGQPPETISSQRIVEGASAEGVEGAFRLCWDDRNLYLLCQVMDPTPMKNDHEGEMLWSGDGLEVFVGSEQLDRPGGLLFTDRQVLLSAGKPQGACRSFVCKVPDAAPIAMEVLSGADGKSYTIEAAIPWSALRVTPEVGKELLFDLAIDHSNDGKTRKAQLMWNGSAKNSGDRSCWGRLGLSP